MPFVFHTSTHVVYYGAVQGGVDDYSVIWTCCGGQLTDLQQGNRSVTDYSIDLTQSGDRKQMERGSTVG